MLTAQLKSNLIATTFGLSLFVLIVPVSHSVIISPVELNLSVNNPVASFTLTNDSAATLTYQSLALSWVQIDGQDIQQETNDLIVTPPIVSIDPQSAQIFRVAIIKKSKGLVEQSYRIILEDISVDVSEEVTTGLSFRFNHNLPVFYAPLNDVNLVVWSVCESTIDGQSCLHVENKGNQHAKIIKLTAVSATAEESSSISKTLLAGSSSQWMFPTMLGIEKTSSIKLITNKGPLTFTIKDLPRLQ
jgi:fimbrial chaperone protein